MAEDSKETPPSQQRPAEAEKKPAVPLAPVPPAVAPAASAPPRPPVPPVPRPQAPATLPPSRPAPPKDSGRRNFVKAIFAVGAILSIIPFVPWGSFLTSTIKTGSAQTLLAQKAVVDNIPAKYGSAAGKVVNVNDLATFPPNDHWVITYPTSGDLSVDADNPDTFKKFELIRLPSELGGNSKKATDFVAFSKVCVHLWCSPNYNPTQNSNPSENGYTAGADKHQQYECPCHGSIYRVPDGLSVAGPASLQASPQNAIPMLTLQADSSGDLYVYFPNADPTKTTVSSGKANIVSVDPIEGDGSIGYGRDYASYENSLKPWAKLQLKSEDKNVVIG